MLAIGMCSVVLVGMAPGAGLPADPAARLRLSPLTFRAADGTAIDAEYGQLQVPERRDRPDGRALTLAFVRFRSTAARPGPPIVYLAGGPGTSGIDSARRCRFELFMALRAVGDVIALDQRGAGSSDPLHTTVKLELPLDQPLTAETRDTVLAHLRDKSAQAAAEAAAQGIDLSAYNTLASSDDLEDLRTALGAERLSLWGISYGTHLALAHIRRHGSRVHRVVLAGVEGPDHTYKLPTYSQQVLEILSAQCASHPVMGKQVPDLMQLIAENIARLERAPARVKLSGLHGKHEVVLGPLDLTVALANALGSSKAMRQLPAVMLRMSRGDYGPLARRVWSARRGSVGAPMHWAMDTASGVSRKRLAEIERLAGACLLGDAATFGLAARGAGWGVPDLGPAFRAAVQSTLPVLCISGTLDGRTPPGNAKDVLKTLPNGRHLIIENAAHSDDLFCSSPLITEVILAFLQDRPLPATRITLPPLDFEPLDPDTSNQ